MSIISASKVGGGLANISSEGGMKFNIVIYIFCTAFYSIDSHCIQVKLKNLKVNHITDLFHVVSAHAYIGHVARYFPIIGETLQRWGKRILSH